MIEDAQDSVSIASRLLKLAKQVLDGAVSAKYILHAGRHYADAVEKAMRASIPPKSKDVPSKHNLAKLSTLLPTELQGVIPIDILTRLRPYLAKAQYGEEPPHSTLGEVHSEMTSIVTVFINTVDTLLNAKSDVTMQSRDSVCERCHSVPCVCGDNGTSGGPKF